MFCKITTYFVMLYLKSLFIGSLTSLTQSVIMVPHIYNISDNHSVSVFRTNEILSIIRFRGSKKHILDLLFSKGCRLIAKSSMLYGYVQLFQSQNLGFQLLCDSQNYVSCLYFIKGHILFKVVVGGMQIFCVNNICIMTCQSK